MNTYNLFIYYYYYYFLFCYLLFSCLLLAPNT